MKTLPIQPKLLVDDEREQQYDESQHQGNRYDANDSKHVSTLLPLCEEEMNEK